MKENSHFERLIKSNSDKEKIYDKVKGGKMEVQEEKKTEEKKKEMKKITRPTTQQFLGINIDPN